MNDRRHPASEPAAVEHALSKSKKFSAAEQLESMLRLRGFGVETKKDFDRRILDEFQGTYAVLILDSAGFTLKTSRYGIIHFMSMWFALKELLEPIVERGLAVCSWFDTDNAFAVFSAAETAVETAIEIQTTVIRENATRIPENRLSVCIGIGFGDIIYAGVRNIYGLEMNLAAKLGEDVAEPGEILLTEGAYHQVQSIICGRLPDHCHIRMSNVDIPYYRLAFQES
jgi:adenylate cyclase